MDFRRCFICGIAGVIKMASTNIGASQLDALLMGLEVRGRDAAGVCLMQDTPGASDPEILVHKNVGRAETLVKSKAYEDFLNTNLDDKTRIALIHTRAATKGHQSKNDNNHPLYSGVSAVVHNGILTNDDALFQQYGLERKAETDSDIIRAIVDREGLTRKAVRTLEKISGSVSSAIVDKRYRGKVLFLRSAN